MLRLIFLLILCFVQLDCAASAPSIGLLPVNDNGRYKPLSVYSRAFLKNLYNASEIEPQDRALYPLKAPDALTFLVHLHLKGSNQFNHFPLFYISKSFSRFAGIKGTRISFNELKQIALNEIPPAYTQEWDALLKKAEAFSRGAILSLPKRRKTWEWIDLKALGKQDAVSYFSNEEEEALKKTWNEWALHPETPEKFSATYWKLYSSILNKGFQISKNSMIFFPTLGQLKVEEWYYRWPLINWVIISYLIALISFGIAEAFKTKIFPRLGWAAVTIGFILQTLLLIARSYILNRPPVSNMAETVIFVPWVGLVLGFFLSLRYYTRFPLASAIALAIILLTIREWTFKDDTLEHVQAVLNSNFWLSIHVLMIVGSYGAFILGGVLGHLYFLRPKSHYPPIILQSLYIGLALLIPGTILGGVWAAQSWGRFWDWDPKESWAFISACTYLLVVHAYRFHKISSKGLAAGAITGLIAISFTWYGVNYILGTGLHSYGFGSGGEWIYFSFVGGELVFLSWFLVLSPKINNKKLTH